MTSRSMSVKSTDDTVDATPLWPRRRWLQHNAFGVALLATPAAIRVGRGRRGPRGSVLSARIAAQGVRIDPAPWQRLVQQAVDAARAAGAQYADARVSRIVIHKYSVSGTVRDGVPKFRSDDEQIGIGVRALVNGYWGFSASTILTSDEVARLARDAVGQATENAKGTPWTVDLGTIPVATGTWTTPHRIDPFSVSIEEKEDFIQYWKQCVLNAGLAMKQRGFPSWLRFVRQERVAATSEGALFTQTLFESGGQFVVATPDDHTSQDAHGLGVAGTGWELFLDAKIPEQASSGQLAHELAQKATINSKPGVIGKYTLVCDGATMARLVEGTLGIATQIDRAMGYEANAAGTSFLDDPLGMLGSYQVTSPLVTVTANRSNPRDLATVKWDDEGVESPASFPLVKNGVLVDFQTTRERAAWLAPYYQKAGKPVRSNGCAASADAHGAPLPLMPNLAMEPSATAIRLEDLIADVPNGILIENGIVGAIDSQLKTGMLDGQMRQIKNGRVGSSLGGSVVLWKSDDIWKKIRAVGGAATEAVVATSAYTNLFSMGGADLQILWSTRAGQPPQVTSHSVRGAAATITDQAIIDPRRKA